MSLTMRSAISAKRRTPPSRDNNTPELDGFVLFQTTGTGEVTSEARTSVASVEAPRNTRRHYKDISAFYYTLYRNSLLSILYN